MGTYGPAWVRACLTAWEPHAASWCPGPAVLEWSPMVLSAPTRQGRVSHPHGRQWRGTGETRLCRAGSHEPGLHKLGLPLRAIEMSRAGSSLSKEGAD